MTSQFQLRQRLPNSRVMRCQTKLSVRRPKIIFAVDAQRSGLFFYMRMNSICNYNQIRIVQIRREIQSGRAEIENLNIRIALV